MKKTLILFFVSVILFAQTNTQPFKNIEEGNNFRLWVNQNYPEYAKKIKLGKTGSFKNSYIQRAYKNNDNLHSNKNLKDRINKKKPRTNRAKFI